MNTRKGMILMLGAAFSFSLMAAISKALGQNYGTMIQVLFRNLIGLLFIGSSLYFRPPSQQGGKPGLLIFRGIVGTLSLMLLYYSISKLGLGTASTYQYTYPIFLALLTWWLVGEKLQKHETAAILIGFLGISLVFRPDFSQQPIHQLAGIGNAILTAISYLSIRQLNHLYDSRVIVLSFMASGVVLPLISMGISDWIAPASATHWLPTGFQWPAHPTDWLLFLGLGLTALAGQILLTNAFSYGRSGEISAMGYSNIVFSTLLGVAMGETWPPLQTAFGMGMIISAGVIISLFQKKSTD